MKIAVPIWQGRVSPVFDVAGQLLAVEWTDGQEVARAVHPMPETSPEDRLTLLQSLGVETLVCAGISQSLEMLLADSGVHVIARVCGDVEDVLVAFVAGHIGDKRFAMPGCSEMQRRQRNGDSRRRKTFDNQ
jgi:predicted Fe-Mo cluster-binding NifX family protein